MAKRSFPEGVNPLIAPLIRLISPLFRQQSSKGTQKRAPWGGWFVLGSAILLMVTLGSSFYHPVLSSDGGDLPLSTASPFPAIVPPPPATRSSTTAPPKTSLGSTPSPQTQPPGSAPSLGASPTAAPPSHGSSPASAAPNPPNPAQSQPSNPLAATTAAPPKNPKPLTYPPDMQQLLQRGYLEVGVINLNTPPFYFEQDGELVGLDIDLAHLIGELMGLEVRFNRQAETYPDLVEMTARGDVDLAISKLSVTIPRLQQVHASPSYIKFKQALLIDRTQLAAKGGKDAQSIQRILKEEPISIGVISKSSYERYAQENFPNAEVVGFDSWTDASKAVAEGKVFAIYRDEGEIKKIMMGQPQLSIKLKSVLLNDLEDNKAILVSLKYPQLAHIVDYTVGNLMTTWTIDNLIDKFLEVFTNPEFASG